MLDFDLIIYKVVIILGCMGVKFLVIVKGR